MEKQVTILTGAPTVVPIATMKLLPYGIEQMMEWVASHRPECLPENADNWQSLFPHDLEEATENDNDSQVLQKRALTDNELLVELAGRKCFDGETEVLTESGWKKFAALSKEEAVATFNRATGLLEFQVPTQHIQKRHVGLMYNIRSRGLSLRVTGDHEMWCQHGAAPWSLHEAASLLGQKYRVQRTAVYPGRTFAEPLWEVPEGKERSWATFLGYYLSEGSLVDGRRYGVGSRVTVYQRPETAGPYLAALADLGLEPKVYVDARNGVLQIALHNTRFADALAVLGDLAQTKRLPDHVFHWPLGVRAALLDALMAGDGTLTKGHRVYTTTSELLAEGVQRLITLSGLPGSISTVAPNGDPKGTSFRGNHVVHRVREGTQTLISVNNKAEHDALEDADETVYCVSVPNRILLVRREGKTMLCANCYDSFGLKAGKKSNSEYIKHTQASDIPHASILYHAKMSFFIAGVSRRVSHELIRNYVGADRDEEGSPSQESTRFTHHYGFFIEPVRYGLKETPCGPDLQSDFKNAMQSAYNYYMNAIDLEVKAFVSEHGKVPTAIDKKRIYEAASSFLPHQAETSFIWTTNPMAVAKFVRERANSASDLEIQRLARTWAKVCVDTWPNLFPQPWMKEAAST